MPQRPTIWRAIAVSCSMSDSAPVLVSPKTSCSADAAAERDLDPRVQLRLEVVEAVALRRREGHAQRHAARDDRHLAHRVGAGREHADDRVPGLVVRRAPAVVQAHHHAALGAEHDALERVGEVGAGDGVVTAARGEQRRLVDEVREVGADHARRRGRDPVEVDVVGQRHAADVHGEDRRAPRAVRRLHRDPAVEAPGPQQRLVEHVGPVGRGDHDHARVGGEAVHLGEDLVQRLLALVVAAAEARRPLTCASGRSRRARR